MTAQQHARPATPENRRQPATLAPDDADQLIHDLRSRAAAIRLLAEALAPDLPPSGPAARLLAQIRDEAADMGDLCDRQLIGHPAVEECSLTEVAGDVAALVSVISRAEVRWRPKGDVWVTGAASEVRRVVVNLVENAARAAGDGWVEVAVSQGAGGAALWVADSGSGPGPWAEALIGDRPPPRGAEHGHGLVAARRLISHLGGSVSVAGHPGGGTAVVVRLPVVADLKARAVMVGGDGSCSSSVTTT